MIEKVDELKISGEAFHSRLFVGTGKFQSGEILSNCCNEACKPNC